MECMKQPKKLAGEQPPLLLLWMFVFFGLFGCFSWPFWMLEDLELCFDCFQSRRILCFLGSLARLLQHVSRALATAAALPNTRRWPVAWPVGAVDICP